MERLSGKRLHLRANPLGQAAEAADAARVAVGLVADQRMAVLGHMNTDLMGSPGGETAFDQRRPVLIGSQDAVARDGGFAALAPHRHLLAMMRVAADRTGDLALARMRHTPNDGLIGTRDAAGSEIGRQARVRRVVLGDDHQPARILVETMNDARPPDAANADETLTAMRQQRVDERAIGIAWRWMDDE